MNSFWSKIITQLILQENQKSMARMPRDSKYAMAKGFRSLKITAFRGLKDIFLIGGGIASAAFGLEGFLLPTHFIDGGATGISLLISELTKVPLYWLLIAVNLPFVFLSFTLFSKQFAVKTAMAITGLAICVATIHFPVVTHDKILVAVFGGFFLGMGIGLAVRGGAVIDGTEVLAIFLSKKFGTTIGDIIVVINILIFSLAAWLLSMEAALYSMITYLVASKALDFIIEGIEEYTGVTIVSTHNDEIRQMVVDKLGRGVTVYKGSRGFGSHGERREIDIVYTVVTRLELNRLNTEIEKIDPNAFVVMNSVKDTKGGMIKKRSHKTAM